MRATLCLEHVKNFVPGKCPWMTLIS
jgi:hypothetical protein